MINTPENINIFIAFVEEDRPFLEELEEHLSVLERLGMVDKIWYNGMVAAGADWEATVLNALHNADIILLLVSSKFIASDFAYDKEMKQAIALHQAGKVKTIPILVRPCLWDRTPFAELQVLPKNKIPVSSHTWKHVDEPYVQIVEEVERMISRIKHSGIEKDQQKKRTKFNESIEEAGLYYAGGKWAEAQARYQEALLLADFESVADLTKIEEKIANCKKEIYFLRNFSRGEKAYNEGRFSDAELSLSQALIFKPGEETTQKLKAAALTAMKGEEAKKTETKEEGKPKLFQLKLFGVEVFKIVISLGLIGVIGWPTYRYWNTPETIIAANDAGSVIYIEEASKQVVLKTEFPEGKDFSHGIAAVKNAEEKWGYIDLNKNTKIDFHYEGAWPHSQEGLAYVRKNGKCGFIDVTGNEKIPIQYLAAYSFSEGLAMVKKGEKDFAFIDKNGREVISDLEGVVTPQFKNGEAIVLRQGRQITIDKKGECLEACLDAIPPEMNERRRNNAIKEYEQKAKKLVEKGEYERALMKLQEVKKFTGSQPDQQRKLENRIDLLQRKVDDRNGASYKKMIKEAEPFFRKGDFIKAKSIYQKALTLEMIFNEEAATNLALCNEYIQREANASGKLYGFLHPSGKWGIKTTQREVLVAPKYDSVGVFSNGFIAVQEEGLWGFVNVEGEVQIKPFYDSVQRFSEAGLAKVIKNGKKGFIDRNGRRARPRTKD